MKKKKKNGYNEFSTFNLLYIYTFFISSEQFALGRFIFRVYIKWKPGLFLKEWKQRILFIFSFCVGLLQSTILESVGCIWFNRSEAKDREIVARK
jgi:hypothetical protein